MGCGNNVRMGRGTQATVLFYLLVLSVLTAAQRAIKNQHQRQHAVCSLKLQGYPDPKTLGVLDAQLHCNSSSPVTIGINTTYLGKFAAQFTGVEVVGDLACQQQARGWLPQSGPSNIPRVPLFALLYFCGDYQLTLHRPLVHNISLQYIPDAWGTAVIALGGDVEATVDGGHLAGNNAGSPLVALQTAAVTLHNWTIIEYNKGYGGAGILATDSANLRLVDTSLRHNHATFGGAIALLRNSSVSMYNVSFSNNSVEQDGGAVYAGTLQHVTVLNTTWNINTAGELGGGLYMDTSVGKIINNTFTQGNATFGGGVFCSGCQLQLASSAFVNNTADSGGALSAEREAQVTMLNTTWNNNTAGKLGGGLHMSNSTEEIINNTFTQGNNANWGGGVYCSGCKLQMTGSAFVNNKAAANGGALNSDHEAQVTVLNTTWNNNTAGKLGGGIYMENSVGKIINNTFTQGNATFGGGVFCSDCQLQLASSAFVNNTADSGGALSAEREAQVTMLITTWNNNTAGKNGGGLRMLNATVTVLNTTWNNNTAGENGGGLYMENSVGEIINNTFTQGNSFRSGGGVLCGGCKLQVTGSAFVNNNAHTGGALYADREAQVTVLNTTWNNNAATFGGGLYLEHSTGTIINSTFTQDHSATWGGGVHCFYCKLQVTGSVFVGNGAFDGGALHASQEAQVTVLNTTWNHNTAVNGGGLYMENSTGVIINNTFTQGNGTEAGGGVFCGGCKLQVTSSAFVNNKAAINGGALYADQEAQVAAVNTTWNNNTAGQFGGGLALYGTTNASLQACTIIRNTAATGGGLYCGDKTSCNLFDSLVAHNHGLYMGGGIVIATNASLLLLGNSDVIGNKLQGGTTWGYGGGVYLSNANFQLDQVVRATHNNSATFDADISSNLTHIGVVGDSVIRGYVNRPGSDEGLMPVALNMSGHYGLPCEGITAQAMNADRTVLATSRSDIQGIAHLSLKVRRPPGQYKFTISAVDWPEIEAADIVLHVRNCVRGEVTPSPDSCQVCQQGYFSFDPTRGVCNTCPSNANCTGGDVILPLPGYWWSSVNSTQVHRCPNPGACNITTLTLLQDCSADPTCGASDTFKDLQCSPEYYGNLCGMCRVGTGATKLFVCRPCLKFSYTIALYVVAAVVMLVFIMLLCHLTRSQSRDALLGATFGEGKLPAAELLRPLVLYSQYMLIISGMNLEWPASILYPFKILAWFWSSASPETLSIECLLLRNASLPASIQKILFYLLMPVILLLLVVLFEAAHLLVKHARSHVVAKQLRDQVFGTILVAVFFFLPSILHTLFSMFACVLIDQAADAPYIPAAIGSFWVYDMNQKW